MLTTPGHPRKSHPPVNSTGIYGEVRRPGMSYRVQLSWQDTQLKGRLGGTWWGEGVHLEARQNELLGSLSGLRAVAVQASLQGQTLSCRFVGTDSPASARLELGENSASGTVYLGGESQPVSIRFAPDRLEAHIGQHETRQDFTLTHSGTPAWVLAVAVLLSDLASRNAWRVLLWSYQGSAEG